MSGKWNKYHENLLKRWVQMSKTYSIMHSLCAQYYANWHKRLGIPVVLIGGATASSIFSSNKKDSEAWTYINGTLALLVAALAGVSNFIGTSEKTSKHQNASFKYTKIAMDIDALLSFGRVERVSSPQEFIQAKKAEMLEIRENVPEVLPWVMNDYLKKFDKSLTDTKCKVNKTGHCTYIEPICILPQRPITNSTGTVNTADGEEILEAPRSEARGLLADFADKLSTGMYKAGEQMQDRHDESESETETSPV